MGSFFTFYINRCMDSRLYTYPAGPQEGQAGHRKAITHTSTRDWSLTTLLQRTYPLPFWQGLNKISPLIRRLLKPRTVRLKIVEFKIVKFKGLCIWALMNPRIVEVKIIEFEQCWIQDQDVFAIQGLLNLKVVECMGP